MRLRNPVLVGALASLFVFGAACSDDGGSQDTQGEDDTTDAPSDGVPVEDWVASVCTSLDDWLTNLEAATEDVQDVLRLQGGAGEGTGDTDTGSTGDVDLDEQAEVLAEFLDEAVDLTDTLVNELEDAGAPDAADGIQIAALFLDSFETARDTFAQARADVDDVPTDDPDDFRDAVIEIGDEIDVAAIEIQTAFDEADQEFDVDELDDAFDDEEACEFLSNAGV